MGDSIRLSEKHGVNPSVDRCFFCGESYAVVMFGKMKNDEQGPSSVCSGGLCDRCQKVKDDGGIFIIETRSGVENPSEGRTGRLMALKKDSNLSNIIRPPELAERIRETGVAYIEEKAFEALFGDYMKAIEKEGKTKDEAEGYKSSS